MKKWLLPFSLLATLTACSASNEDKQQAQDKFAREERENSGQSIDIRPPTTPLSIIRGSVAQFDGERASVVYSADKQDVYNLKQIERLLREQDISFNNAEGKIQTDWANTGRADEVGDVKIRYQIEQIANKEASALVVSVLQMKRDEVIFTPSQGDKQRYASDRLNQLVGDLNRAYQQQQQQLNSASAVSAPVQSQLGIDSNQRPALIIDSNFAAAWLKSAQVLPAVGFEIKGEMAGRGARDLKYRPIDEEEWRHININRPELDSGSYQMQLSAMGSRSALVITDEDGKAISGNDAQAIYQALQTLLAR